MPAPAATVDRPVGLWLLAIAAMIVGQVLLGGITRLTGSGLSITEWKPIVGAVPPLDDAAWQVEFDKYKEIPQFKLLNAHFGLSDFKRIYFWEWAHRLWGRLLGAAFIVPLVVFWRRQRLKGLGRPLLVLLGLGAFQGFLGWFMVASGLKDLVYVSHLRLAAHFVSALVLLAAVYWVALSRLALPEARRGPAVEGTAARWLLAGLTLQLVYGAFVAGLKAAAAAPTWPTLNGLWLPRGMFDPPADAFNGPLTVQFIHRALAYALTVAVIAAWVGAVRRSSTRWPTHLPAAAVLLQVTLGAAATLNVGNPGPFVVLAAAHQLGAVALLLSLLTVAFFAAPASAADGAVSAPGAANRSPA